MLYTEAIFSQGSHRFGLGSSKFLDNFLTNLKESKALVLLVVV